MNSTVTTRRHVIDVSNTQQVRVTEIVATNGQFQRAVRVYGAPDGTDGPPVLEVILTADTRAKIEVLTPELTF